MTAPRSGATTPRGCTQHLVAPRGLAGRLTFMDPRPRSAPSWTSALERRGVSPVTPVLRYPGLTMLKRFLERRAEAAYTLLRVVAGLMFAFHGAQKLFGVMTKFQPPVGSQLWFGAIIELVTGIAMAAGIFTTLAAFLASGTMAVAYVQFHWKLGRGSPVPAVNQGELAVLYSVGFLYIACHGAGKWSIDKLRR